MIFVTVGTHEQQFNRLIEVIDELSKNGSIGDEVIAQIGFSTYKPKYCQWERFFPYQKMCEYMKRARIVITHGGPSSFIMALQIGKIPIVVPRQNRFGEHVNDHQVAFSRAVVERMGTIIVVEDMNDLKNTILNYEDMVLSMPADFKSNNARFNEKFAEIVNELVEDKRGCKRSLHLK